MINGLKKLPLILLLSTLLLVQAVWADNSPANETENGHFQWTVGEHLHYKVKYTFLTVGLLNFWVLGKETFRGREVYRCKMHVKSKSIPFVKLNDTYISLIDAEEFYSHRFWAYEQMSDHVLKTYYDFNYEDSTAIIFNDKITDTDTIRVVDSTAVLTHKVQDGLSLLYFARAFSPIQEKKDVAVYAWNDESSTYINFAGTREKVKTKGKKIPGWFLDGKMKFVGIAGVKEDFKGWFSEDPQKVPLQAHMKAIVGSIKLNLESWSNWEADSLVKK